MELVDRYLQAVKFWLPKEQKDDILAELSADIQSQIEDRESSLNRALTQSEIEDILKHRGRPALLPAVSAPRNPSSVRSSIPSTSFASSAHLRDTRPVVRIEAHPPHRAPLLSRRPVHPNVVQRTGADLRQLWNMAFVAAGTIT